MPSSTKHCASAIQQWWPSHRQRAALARWEPSKAQKRIVSPVIQLNLLQNTLKTEQFQILVRN